VACILSTRFIVINETASSSSSAISQAYLIQSKSSQAYLVGFFQFEFVSASPNAIPESLRAIPALTIFGIVSFLVATPMNLCFVSKTMGFPVHG